MKLLKHLYVQVLLAIVAGMLIGYFDPAQGVKLKPLGDGFIKLIKMLIAPIIFTTRKPSHETPPAPDLGPVRPPRLRSSRPVANARALQKKLL